MTTQRQHKRSVPGTLAVDHLVQRGGAERLVIEFQRRYPELIVTAPVARKDLTYSEIDFGRVRSHWASSKITATRHRMLLPIYTRLQAAEQRHVKAGPVVQMTAGLSHLDVLSQPRIVYWLSPARWLHDGSNYLRSGGILAGSYLKYRASALKSRDLDAARAPAIAHFAISSYIADAVRDLYGIESKVIGVPFRPSAPQALTPMPGVLPGTYFLLVSRMMPYKNVDRAIEAFRMTGLPLVAVGAGPLLQTLRRTAPSNVQLVGNVDESTLHWLYSNARALVAIAEEDFGLTPLEAAQHGTPSIAARHRGYLDTIQERVNGLFVSPGDFDELADATLHFEPEMFKKTDVQRSINRFSADSFFEAIDDASSGACAATEEGE